MTEEWKTTLTTLSLVFGGVVVGFFGTSFIIHHTPLMAWMQSWVG